MSYFFFFIRFCRFATGRYDRATGDGLSFGRSILDMRSVTLRYRADGLSGGCRWRLSRRLMVCWWMLVFGLMSPLGYIINKRSANPTKPPHARTDKKICESYRICQSAKLPTRNPSRAFYMMGAMPNYGSHVARVLDTDSRVV